LQPFIQIKKHRVPAFRKVILLLFLAVISITAYSQEKKLIPITRYPSKMKDTSTKVQQDTAEQKDLNDVLQSIFTKNYKPVKTETIGRKPIISFIPAVGYSLQTKAAATLTGNIVFRDSPDSKISGTATIHFAYRIKYLDER
jgi:hypothetical protein